MLPWGLSNMILKAGVVTALNHIRVLWAYMAVHFPFIRNHFSYADVLNDRLLCPLFGAMKEC